MKSRPARQRSAPPSRSGGSFLLGLFVGLVLGLGIALGVAFYLNKTPIPFLGKSKSTAGKDAEPAKAANVAGMPQGGSAGAGKGNDKGAVDKAGADKAAEKADKPKFDFYKILPGGEEPVSEKDLAKAAKSAPEAQKGVYLVQAGSFQNPADADNQKAKIAILGFESVVESTNLPDKGTWYRVRLGPYTSLDEINRVRRTLSQNGIDASLVKVKEVAAAKTN